MSRFQVVGRGLKTRPQPKNLHLMPKGSRTTRLCGATTGGYVRMNDVGRAWLKKALARGAGLCPECARLDAEFGT